MASPPVTLLALATAVPPNKLEQSAVVDLARRIYAKSFTRYPKLADVFVNAGIERRYSVRPIEWFDEPTQKNRELFRRNREFWFRNREFSRSNPKSSPDEVFGTHRSIVQISDGSEAI